jgi:hypothetical protein
VGIPENREAVLEVAGTIVDAPDNVAVKVNHARLLWYHAQRQGPMSQT